MTLTEIHAQCEPDGDCLLWTGLARGKNPRLKARHPKMGHVTYLSVRRLVWQAVHGEDATGPLKTMCGNAMCLNPDHIVMPSGRDTTSLTSIHARCTTQGECLLWTGRRGGGSGGIPLTADSSGTSLRPVVWGLAGKGETPAYIGTNCGNSLCLNPEHLMSVGVGQAPPRPRPAKAEVIRELLEPPRHRGRAFHSGPLILDLPAREAKARIGTKVAAVYGGIVPPNSPESFAICDAVRRSMGTTPRIEQEKPWLKGRGV